MYKVTQNLGSANASLKYTIPNLDNLTLGLSSPVSPMALPQESAKENILVKMEGNTQTLSISWKIADLSGTFAQNGIASSDAITPAGTLDSGGSLTGNDTTPPNDSGVTNAPATDVVNWFLSEFQGKDITDKFYFKVGDMTIMEGFMTKMNFSISGSSPVVWSAQADFIVGNVINMYDGDSSSEPRSFAVKQVDNAGKHSSEGGYSAPNNRIRLRWTSPTDTSSTVTSYKIFKRSAKDDFLEAADVAVGSLGNYSGVSGSLEWLDVTTGTTVGDKTQTSLLKYTYYVKAVNTGGDGLPTEQKSVQQP